MALTVRNMPALPTAAIAALILQTKYLESRHNMMRATLLKNGLIVDGDNRPAWPGDVLLARDRIVALAAPGQMASSVMAQLELEVDEIDCTGKVIAPGFIDVHTHDDAAVLDKPDMLPKLSQGVTTVVVGNCGISLVPMVTAEPAAPLSLLGRGQFRFPGMAAYAQAVNAARPGVNVAALVGHTTLRMRHMARLDRPAHADEQAALTASQAGLPLVLSHHKCAGPANWGRTRETLPLIEQLARNQDIGMDVYPYTAGSTVLREDLVDGVIDILVTGSQPHPEMAGRYLADISKTWDLTQQEACRRLMPGGACYFQMREDDVDRVIAHPLSMIGSDGLPHDERPHPRLWGAFPRVLARYWREKGLLQLEQAIHKMTGLSARLFKLDQRGLLKPGYIADVLVFDPIRVKDLATYENPMQFSAGIEKVWVNGALSYTAELRGTGERAGRFVKRASI